MNSSERTLQKLVIKHLEKNGWQKAELKNLEDLKQNFRNILNLRNARALQSLDKTEISNKEFDRFLALIENNNTISDFARFFLDDDNQITTDQNEALYLNVFNKKKWCDNVFQIAEEVSNNGIRHDILLLINGLPICNIEMKKSSVTINNAYEQTRHYSKKMASLLKFVQIFVISNENETRYYANGENLNRKFAFRYADENNVPIDNIFKFIDQFMDSCNFSKYISRYVINKEESKVLLAMRPYQVHGAEKALEHIANSNKNGYLWHATGSGKTITSFKVAQIISKEMPQYDKVIFLVDRTDLDSQTIKEYNSFLSSHNKIQETNNSRILLEQLTNSSTNDKLIITTIQKMNNLLTSEDDKTIKLMNEINKKNYIFIIDECHRSQFGEMNSNIRNNIKNIRYIGFTGTPIFTADSEDKLVTKDIFHDNLHKYLMQNAIEDGNVLPFHVSYHNNSEKISDEDINKILTSESHIKNVVNDVLNNFNRRSVNRKYSAILVLPSIDSLIETYRQFKSEQKSRESADTKYKQLKISATFSFNDGYSIENTFRREALIEIIGDFNKYTNSNEGIEKVDNFQNRLQSILKDEDSEPQINIVLVVDQLLTGFDAKRINTVYLNKNVKKHALIQAISRTNRIFVEDKERGQIITYVPSIKENLEEAIKMYTDGANVDLIVKRDFENLLSEASKEYAKLISIDIEELLKNPAKNKNLAKEYITRVNNLSTYFKVIRTVDKFDDNLIGSGFSIDELNKMIKYSKVITEQFKKTEEWKEIIDNGLPNPFDEVDMPLFIDDAVTIDANYIRLLLGYAISKMDRGDVSASRYQIEQIKEKIEIAGSSELLGEVFNDLLEKFNGDETINIAEALREIFNYKTYEFKEKYSLTDDDINEQIYHFKLKERYAYDVIEKWIFGLGDFKDLKFLEKVKMKTEKEKYVINHLDLLRTKEDIFGG